MTNTTTQPTQDPTLPTFAIDDPATTPWLKKRVTGSCLVVRHNPSGKELIVLFDTRQLPRPGQTFACAIIGEIGWVHVQCTDCTPLRRTSEYRKALFQASKIPPL